VNVGRLAKASIRRYHLCKGKERLMSLALRGGSWNNDEDNLRCSARNNNHPDNHNDNMGFRVVFPQSCTTGLRTNAGPLRSPGSFTVHDMTFLLLGRYPHRKARTEKKRAA